MEIIAVLLLSLAATSDSFLIGFHYGIKKVQINNASNMFISVICFTGTIVSMLAGNLMRGVIGPQFTSVIGGAVLCLLGLFMLRSALWKKQSGVCKKLEDPALIDLDLSQVIEVRESLLIGLLLALNNIGLGMGAGIGGMPVMPVSLFCATGSYIQIKLGYMVGDKIVTPFFSIALESGSALIVLLLGLGRLLEMFW